MSNQTGFSQTPSLLKPVKPEGEIHLKCIYLLKLAGEEDFD